MLRIAVVEIYSTEASFPAKSVVAKACSCASQAVNTIADDFVDEMSWYFQQNQSVNVHMPRLVTSKLHMWFPVLLCLRYLFASV